MPRFISKQEARINDLEQRLNKKHTPEQEEAFAKICNQVYWYCEQCKQELPQVDITIKQFYAAAREKTSAELKLYALEHGVTAEKIAEIAPNFLALLADANRFGYSWDDMFAEDRIQE